MIAESTPNPAGETSDQSAEPKRPPLERPRGTRTVSAHWLAVFERDGFMCGYCGVDLLRDAGTLLQATVDQIRPRAKGGSDNQENLVSCCYACNQLKGCFVAETVEDGRAYVTLKRAAFVSYFASAVQYHGVTLPTRRGDNSSLRFDMVAALAQFADQAARIIARMKTFQVDAERVLSRFEAVDVIEAICGKAVPDSPGPAKLPADDRPLNLAEIFDSVEAIVAGKKATTHGAPRCKVDQADCIRPPAITPDLVARAERLLQDGRQPLEVCEQLGLRLNVVEAIGRELTHATA